MTGTQLFDSLALEADSTREASDAGELARLAEQMVAASISSGQMLREQRDRMFPTTSDSAALSVAHALRTEFQEWVRDAETVLTRATGLKHGHAISKIGDLRDLIGLTDAMLQITPESHRRALDQVRTGETISIGELRRELQLERGR